MLFGIINNKEDFTGLIGKLGSNNTYFSVIECGPTAEKRKVPDPMRWGARSWE